MARGVNIKRSTVIPVASWIFALVRQASKGTEQSSLLTMDLTARSLLRTLGAPDILCGLYGQASSTNVSLRGSLGISSHATPSSKLEKRSRPHIVPLAPTVFTCLNVQHECLPLLYLYETSPRPIVDLGLQLRRICAKCGSLGQEHTAVYQAMDQTVLLSFRKSRRCKLQRTPFHALSWHFC